MSNLKIGPLKDGLRFGATVTGLTSELLDQPETRRQLHDLWIDRGMILFRDFYGPANQVKLSRVFGELSAHPLPSVRTADGFPELIDLHQNSEVGTLVDIDGEVLVSYIPWHFDHCYNDHLNRGGVLRPVKIAPKGGQTGFLDRAEAYERLPARLKARAASLEVLYILEMNYRKQRFARHPTMKVVRDDPRDTMFMASAKDFPRAIHPLVYKKPDDGRMVLNLSPWFCVGLVGMENEEGDALLEEIAQHMINSPSYFHTWQDGDMIAWDNWRMLHAVTGMSPTHHRQMQRTTIVGDYELGRFEHGAKGRVELERDV